MLIQTLAISSIVLGIYLILAFFKNSEIQIPIRTDYEYHIGCYSSDKQNNHYQKLSQFLQSIQKQNVQYQIQSINTSISYRIDFNKEAKQVALKFQTFLNEYYKLKSDSDFDNSYYNSLQIAKDQAYDCIDQIDSDSNFTKQDCLKNWNLYIDSKNQYETVKTQLAQKIRKKQSKQKKIEDLFFNNDFQSQKQLQKKYRDQIKQINDQKLKKQEELQLVKVQKSLISHNFTSDSDKLKQLTLKFNDCQKNKKVITICNELVQDLKIISPNITKDQLQTKINRKLGIIQSIQNVLKQAKKINNDAKMIAQYEEMLQKNKEQYKVLIARVQRLQLNFQEKYCLQCSQEKVEILRHDIQNFKKITQLEKQALQNVTIRIQKIQTTITSLRTKKDEIQKQLQQIIKQKFCATEECLQQRRNNIALYKRQLQELKLDVLNQKQTLAIIRIGHNEKIKTLQNYIQKLSKLNECNRKRDYYDKLRAYAPKNDQNQMMHISELKDKILQQLRDFDQKRNPQIKVYQTKEQVAEL